MARSTAAGATCTGIPSIVAATLAIAAIDGRPAERASICYVEPVGTEQAKGRAHGAPTEATMPAGDAARATLLALLAERAAEATVCPSEVARVLAASAGAGEWRGRMPAVHAAVDALAGEGLIRLSWKGKAMAARDGPYRIGRP